MRLNHKGSQICPQILQWYTGFYKWQVDMRFACTGGGTYTAIHHYCVGWEKVESTYYSRNSYTPNANKCPYVCTGGTSYVCQCTNGDRDYLSCSGTDRTQSTAYTIAVHSTAQCIQEDTHRCWCCRCKSHHSDRSSLDWRGRRRML